MTWFAFAVLSLAAWRTWRILSTDTILDAPRDWILKAHTVQPGVTKFGRPRLADFAGCAWCLGFWVTLAWFAAWHYWSHPHTVLIALPFAGSAVVGLLTQLD